MMNFPDAIESSLGKWITFSGRAPRSEFWFFVLFYWIVIIAAHIGMHFLGTLAYLNRGNMPIVDLCAVGMFVIHLLKLWIVIALVSVEVRRLHDVDRSGWWYWIGLTVIGMLYPLFVWKCTVGTTGDNRFGPDPLQKASS